MVKDSKKIKKIKIMLAVTVGLIFVASLCFLFAGKNFLVLKEIFRSGATKEEVKESIEKLGIRSYLVVFLLSMMQVTLTFIPAEPLHVISGVCFGLHRGMAVCLLGILAGNTIVFILYKIFGTKLTEFFATNVEFDFQRASKSKKIALIVMFLYVLPAIPYGLICFFAVSMGMKFPKYIIVTGLGSIPSLVLDVGLGHLTMATSWVVSIVVFVVIVILLILLFRFKKQIFAKVNEHVIKAQEKERKRVGKYNHIISTTGIELLLQTAKRKMRVQLTNNVGKVEKPSIVICNHGSFYDFVFAGKLLKFDRPHFIAARMFFHNKWLRWIIEKTGGFPKSMFTTDLENAKNCLKVLNNNGVLGLMPEARLSASGRMESIQDVTMKFIKRAGVPVYVIKLNGAYLAKPKWGDKMRKGGLVTATLDLLMTADEVKSLDQNEFREKIENALRYDEWAWLENHPEIEYHHDTLANGVENILCVCPNCKSEHTLQANGKTITCEKCDMVVTMDNRYALSGVEFKNIGEWYDWQKGVLRERIENDADFCITSKVKLHHLDKKRKKTTEYAGEGEVCLDKSGLRYDGTEYGKNISKFFPMENIYRILFGAGEDFEIYEDKELYYFVPENKRECVTYSLVSEIFKEKEEQSE